MEQRFHELLHARNARGTANKHNFVDLFRLERGVFQSLLARADGALHDRLNQSLELLARNLALVTKAPGQRNVQFHGGLRREKNLGLDDGFADSLDRLGIAPEIELHVSGDVV